MGVAMDSSVSHATPPPAGENQKWNPVQSSLVLSPVVLLTLTATSRKVQTESLEQRSYPHSGRCAARPAKRPEGGGRIVTSRVWRTAQAGSSQDESGISRTDAPANSPGARSLAAARRR